VTTFSIRTRDKWQYPKFPEPFLVISETTAASYGTIPENFLNLGRPLNKSLLKATAGYFAKYQAWLEKQPLFEHSKRAYRSRLNHFLGFLDSSGEDYKAPFKDETERDYILKDYKRFLKQKHKASPNTVNAALAAADHFYQFLGLPKTKVKREDLPAEAPRALTNNEQRSPCGQLNVPNEQKTGRSSPSCFILESIYSSVQISTSTTSTPRGARTG
jgi:hypothetical protein